METKPAKPGDLEMLLDGAFIDVIRHADKDGKPLPFDTEGARVITERIKVRKISIQKMDALGSAFGKFAREVACYLDRESDFVESLSEDSFIAAMSEGRRLNFTSFEKWLAWQLQTAKALESSGDLGGMVSAAVQKALAGKIDPPALVKL